MSRVNTYNKIKKGISEGIYQRIRLVRLNDHGEREILLPYSKAFKEGECAKRFEHIKYQLEHNLSPGKYIIECSCGSKPSALEDKFELVINPPLTIQAKPADPEKGLQEDIQDKTKEQEIMNEISLEEYTNLVNQVAQLKAELFIVSKENERLNAQLNSPELSDKGTVPTIMKALDDNIPTILSIFDKFMSQRDRQMDLKERELSLSENGSSGKKYKIRKGSPDKVDRNQILTEMIKLNETNPESFDATMDEMEEKNPELYDWICEQMGIQFEDDGEEEQE